MAYKATVARACTNREAAMAEIHSQLIAMGWTYVDGACTNPVTVAYTAVNITDETFTAVGHTFVEGQPVMLATTGTAPTGLTKDTVIYYIKTVVGDTFKLAATYGGAAINITGQGTGDHTITEAYRVFSSNGESSDKVTQYIRIFLTNTTTSIICRAAYGWNSTTHAPIGESHSGIYGLVTTNQTAFYLWIYGDKDFVTITTKISTTYTKMLFGFGVPFVDNKTTFTAAATTGTNVSVEVADSSSFEAGSLYQIVGIAMEGRDQVTVSSITDSTHIVIANLPRNYGAGSVIGDYPCCFGNSRSSTSYTYNLFTTCCARVVGTDECSIYSMAAASAIVELSGTDPDERMNKYILQTLAYCSDTVGVNAITSTGFYIAGDKILNMAITGISVEDTFSVGKKSSGTSSGGNSTTEMNDTSKSWATNAFANKVVIITFGTGIGQIKKISSNTATAITLADGYVFDTVPDTTSQYVICEKGYRYVPSGQTSFNTAHREGV